MAWQSLTGLGLDISVVTAEGVKTGGLDKAGLLLVPGGWPSLKQKALGRAGIHAIREFVSQGGSYLGICGGAGLGLTVPGGLGLLPLGRIAGEKRLPSISGPVFCLPGPKAKNHPIWREQSEPASFFVWFPAGFELLPDPPFQVVACYQKPAPGFCSADLRADQVDPGQWPHLERQYNMRLDPRGLSGRPAVIQGRFGQGRVCLSYLHFDTIGHQAGGQVLSNIWHEWLGLKPGPPIPLAVENSQGPAWELAQRAGDLWEYGLDLGLWQKRHPALPLWRRGARGLELWSLARFCRALAQYTPPDAPRNPELEQILEPVWRQGKKVLEAQALRLENGAQKADPAGPEAAWFPLPRRTSGDLALALAALDKAFLTLLQQSRQRD